MIRDWHCPECKRHERTDDAGKGTRYHTCPSLRGLSVPMVLAGIKARIVLRERDDYVGGERVRLDPERRRPVMSIVTQRETGQDVVVLAPTATARGA